MIFLTPDGQEIEVNPHEEEEARNEGLIRAFSFLDQTGEEIVVPENDLEDAARMGLKPITSIQDTSNISPFEAAARGFASSASLGFADEIAGAGQAAYQKLLGNEEEQDTSFTDLYKRERDAYRLRNEQAWDTQTKSYAGGYGGGLFINPGASLAKGGAKAAQYLVGQGAAAGLGGGGGLGQADLTAGEYGKLAGQTAIGGALGGAMSKVVPAMNKSVMERIINSQIAKGIDSQLNKINIPPNLKEKIKSEVFEKGKSIEEVLRKQKLPENIKTKAQEVVPRLKKVSDFTKNYAGPAGMAVGYYAKAGVPMFGKAVGTAALGVPYAAFQGAKAVGSKMAANVPRQTAETVAEMITSNRLRPQQKQKQEPVSLIDDESQTPMSDEEYIRQNGAIDSLINSSKRYSK